LKQKLTGSYKKLRETNILSNFFNLSSIQISNVLLLLFTIRIITGSVGIEGYGMIMFAYMFSILAGTIINYGTIQSGVKDTAYNLTDKDTLSSVFYNILCIRVIIFTLYVMGLFLFYWFHVSYYPYILLAAPVVLAEVFNPLCFFIGAEKLKIFNIYNLIANIAAVLLILFFIKKPGDGIWVNFILGLGNCITYVGLLIYFASRYELAFHVPLKTELRKIGTNNFYLTVNNISGNLQQSVIIFALKWNNSSLLVLGAYTLCDRIIGQCRNLLSTVASAIYPNAVNVYKQSMHKLDIYRRKLKYLTVSLSFAGAIIIFILADFIIYTLSKQHNSTAIMILRIMAFVPVISSLNIYSLLDILLKNKNIYLFKASIILFITAVLVAFTVTSLGNYFLIAGFTLIIESCACLLYEYAVKKFATQNA